MGAFTAVAIALLSVPACAQGTVRPGGDCRAPAHIVRVEPATEDIGSPSLGEPVIISGSETYRLTGRDLLCPNDLLLNPFGSGVTVVVAVPRSGEIRIGPGHHWPSWGDLPGNLRAIIFGTSMAQDPNGVKGFIPANQEVWPRVLPSPPTVSKVTAVLAWGPLTVAWTPSVPRTATIINTGKNQQTLSGVGAVRIDLARDCPGGCVVRIPGVAELRITVLPQDNGLLPPQLSEVRVGDAGDQAREGEWLLRTYRTEERNDLDLQGGSLLWSAACTYPDLIPVVQALYGLDKPPAVCSVPVQ